MAPTDTPLDPSLDSGEFSTDYELGQDNIRPFGLDIHNPGFLISDISIGGFVPRTSASHQGSASANITGRL